MKKMIYSLQAMGIVILVICFVAFSTEAKAQAIVGMKLCISVIVPSLLPIMILTSTAIKADCSTIFELIFKPIAKLLRLPSCTVCVILFGLIGGYPAGAMLTNELYSANAIDSYTAKRLLRFNYCGGVAFIITAVGTANLNSTLTGVVLYLTNVLSSLLICGMETVFAKKPNDYCIKLQRQNFTQALISSVESSTKSIAIMCGYIVFFSALSGLTTIPSFIMPFIEITNGLFKNNQAIPLPYLCFFLCFGGLCIHFQLLGIMKNIGMKYFDFFVHRVAGGVLSYFLGKAYIFLFAPNKEVFSNLSSVTPKFNEINFGLSLMFLTSCVVIVIDINNKKSRLI